MTPTARTARCFNEAGGFLPRKHDLEILVRSVRIAASMRPGDFSPGNPSELRAALRAERKASMRPGDFSPGNEGVEGAGRHGHPDASMRPGDFSPGNTTLRSLCAVSGSPLQ